MYRSRIILAGICRNLKIEHPEERNIVSMWETPDRCRTLALIDPDDLIGRTYLSPPDEFGDRDWMKIVEVLDEHHTKVLDDPDILKFRCVARDGETEELKTYNELLDKVEQVDDNEGTSRFKSICSHQGPLKKEDLDYKGST